MNSALETVLDSLGLNSPVIGNYTLDGVLGRGGMGVVLRARQNHLKRPVALKIIPAASGSNDNLLRFEAEIKSLSRLSHPNIVRAFDAGRTDGVMYLAMELVEGETLDLLVQRNGPLKPPQAVDVLKQTARALSYAHRNGIIHRDVKPANLMLDPAGTVRLLDLGMMRVVRNPDMNSDSPTRLELTGTGTLLGTPEFMAPEQAEDPTRSDERSDLYALGGTFYYLLTGKRMYESANRIDAILSHQTGNPPQLTSRLDGVFQRMVARDPADRYPSMDAVLRELDSVLRADRGRGPAVRIAAGAALLAAAFLMLQSHGENPSRGTNLATTTTQTPAAIEPDHPHAALEAALCGTTWNLNSLSTFRFEEGGIARPVEKPGEIWTWAAISGTEVVIRDPTGWIHVLEFDETVTTCRLHELGFPSKMGDRRQHQSTGRLVK